MERADKLVIGAMERALVGNCLPQIPELKGLCKVLSNL